MANKQKTANLDQQVNVTQKLLLKEKGVQMSKANIRKVITSYQSAVHQLLTSKQEVRTSVGIFSPTVTKGRYYNPAPNSTNTEPVYTPAHYRPSVRWSSVLRQDLKELSVSDEKEEDS